MQMEPNMMGISLSRIFSFIYILEEPHPLFIFFECNRFEKENSSLVMTRNISNTVIKNSLLL